MIFSDVVRENRAEKRVPVEPEFWLLIFGDLFVFSAMFIAFIVARFESEATTQVFIAGSLSLNQAIGLSNTLILLTSSLFVAQGLAYFRANQFRLANRSLLCGIGCGLSFVGLKLFEYIEKYDQGLTVTTSDFFGYYFTFTGVHLLHVVIGISLLGFIVFKIKKQQEQALPSQGLFEGVACYWHMVDLLWLMLFSLFYLLN
ncbi:MAG: cytochrome c oxidase subunit 3 [Pseudomonadales bacterium]|nr:cytochrome c oxidase subunit 3 [Pseudomonadales bacterium]